MSYDSKKGLPDAGGIVLMALLAGGFMEKYFGPLDSIPPEKAIDATKDFIAVERIIFDLGWEAGAESQKTKLIEEVK